MEGPSDEFRVYVWEQSQSIESEDALAELLEEIAERVGGDVETGLSEEDPEHDLCAVGSWASVASDVVARASAPASPWPGSIAGWGMRAVRGLRSVASTLSGPLGQVAPALGASGFSIGVSFPWGIQISLAW